MINTFTEERAKIKPDFESETHKWWLESAFDRHHKEKLFAYIVEDKESGELNRVLTDGKNAIYECTGLEDMACRIDIILLTEEKNV